MGRNGASAACFVVCLLAGLFTASVRPSVSVARDADRYEVGPVSALAFNSGTMWLGTETGELIRIERLTGRIERSTFPGGSPIRSLAVDPRNVVWAASEGGGLGAYDGGNWIVYTPSDSSFPSLDVRAVALDVREDVWAATDSGLAHLKDAEWILYNAQNSGLIDDDVTALVAGDDVWAGTSNGLSLLSGSLWTTYQTSNSGLPDNRIRALASRGGAIWVGMETGLAQKSLDWKTAPDVQGVVLSVAPDAAGGVWLNVAGEPAHLAGCDWQPNAATEDQGGATALALDQQGQVWVGIQTGVVRLAVRADQAAWTALPLERPVEAMAVADERLWIVSPGQAAVFRLEDARPVVNRGLRGEPRGAVIDGKGRLWVATWGEGVARLSGRNWTYLTEDDGLPSNRVGAVSVAGDGSVWAGTAAGLARLEGDHVETLGAGPGQAHSEATTSAATGPDGRVWLGTFGGGLTIFDPRSGQWDALTAENSALASNYVSALSFDQDGSLWIGTSGAGIVQYDGERFLTFRAGPNGPSDDFVTALTVDDDGRVWAGGETGGLAELDHCRWTHYVSGPVETSITALISAPAGQLFVGSERGLWSVRVPAASVAHAPAPLISGPPETLVSARDPRSASVQTQAGAERWISHAVGHSVHAVVSDGQWVWAATMGGAIRWNPADGSFRRFEYPQDGIGSNRVVSASLDPEGRVWLGTQNRGVSVFDGRAWIVYHTNNSGLPNDYVNAVAFDSTGRAWLATMGGGLAMLDGDTWTVYDTQNSGLIGDYVWHVAIDPQGRVWAGTLDGLCYFDGQSWTSIPDTSNVHCVASDSEGGVWFGDSYGLNRVESDKAVKVGNSSVYTRDVYSIVFEPNGTAWVGARHGVFRLSGDELIHISLSTTGLRGQEVYAVSVDADGAVWFGANGEDGISRFDGRTWDAFHTTFGPNPAGPGIRDVFRDNQDRLWFATDRGASVYDGRAWTAFTTRNSGLAGDSVLVISQDSRGRLWFGTDTGLSVWDGSRWDTFRSDNSPLPDGAIQAIAFDREDRAWLGSRDGLSLFDGQTWQDMTDIDSNPDHRLTSISDVAVDKEGRVWVASFLLDAITMFDGRRWTRFGPEEVGVQSYSVSASAIDIDASGRVWIGAGDGVVMFDGRRWTSFPTANRGLNVNSVFDLVVDPKGDVWAGGYHGLIRLQGGVWGEYASGKTPLVGDFVSALAVDRAGHIWAGTENGGVSEFVPGPKAPPPPPTPTPWSTPTEAPRPIDTPAPPPPPPTAAPSPPPAPPTADAAARRESSPFFWRVWKDMYGGEGGPLGWAVNEGRRIWCADQLFEHGIMFWRNNDPQTGTVYVMRYANDSSEQGLWQSFLDTWNSSEPASAGLMPPPGLAEPVRGFGKVWRGLQGGGSTPPDLGWALGPEQGSDLAEYQDFQGGTIVYSPRLNRVIVLSIDGTWRSFPV